jgi:small-conductance mechanosensitive channel
MIEQPLLIYLISTGLGGAIIFFWGKNLITKAESKRTNRVKRLRIFDAIRSKTPLDSPHKEARDAALESVATRYTIIKRVFSATLAVIWLLAIIFPFLGEMPAAVISVLVAAAGIIIGIAARPFIENLVSGMIISFSRPVRTGDTIIIDDEYGTIEDITMSHTVVKSWNWRRYVIPNSLMLKKEFINCSLYDPYQWAHVEFWVSCDAELEHVRDIAIKSASESQYFANYEQPRFWVMETGKEGVKCWVAAWADSPNDAWFLRHEIRTNIISKLKESGIKTHQYVLSRFSQ